MAHGSSESSDVYVRQLHELFLNCDSSRSGYLDTDGLVILCGRLNLDDNISKRIIDLLQPAQLLNRHQDKGSGVTFDQFKETFVSVLTEFEQIDLESEQGQPDAAEMEESALILNDEERHLKEIWKELGVGKNGYLTVEELGRVCEYLEMGQMTHTELEQLFAKLDVDRDGHVSFGEFLHGLFENIEPPTSASPSQPLPRENSLTGSRRTFSLPVRDSDDGDRRSASSSNGHEGILAFLDRDGTGYSSSEAIVNLWETIGVAEGELILELLHLDSEKPVNLVKLSLALMEEVHGTEMDSNIIYDAALKSMEHALIYLQSQIAQLNLERAKLSTDLKDARTHSSDLIREFDDACDSVETAKSRELT